MAMRRLDLVRLGSRPDPGNTWSMGPLTLGVMLFAAMGQAQVVEPFDIRYQTQQNGGIVFHGTLQMLHGEGKDSAKKQKLLSQNTLQLG